MRRRAAPPASPSTIRTDAQDVLEACPGARGPAVIQAVVDRNEPPLPGNITMEQALHFAEAMVKGDKRRSEIIKTIAENKVREVV